MVVRILLITLLLLHGAATWAADIEATLDRNPVAAGESFALTFQVRGNTDADPDFSPLEALFEILHRSEGSRIEIVNGRMDRTRQWQLTLQARSPGSYTIPSIDFGNDRSNQLQLTVRAAADPSTSDPSVFLEAELAPAKAWVQSQVIYTLRLLRSVNLRSGNLSEPNISGVEAIVEKLGEDRNYETVRNGVRLAVTERRYAIFPQQSGTLRVAPTLFRGQFIVGERFSLENRVQASHLASRDFSLEVLPIPADAPRPWLPGRDLRLTEEWSQDPPVFRVGEPVTRTLTLQVDGIAGNQLPDLRGTLPEGLKQYPDQPLVRSQPGQSGVQGTRQEKIALIPGRPGHIELPAIEVPWWNTETGTREIARIPARSIEVSPADGEQAEPVALSRPPPAADSGIESEAEIRYSSGFWPWLSLGLAFAWAGTVLLWWQQKRADLKATAPPAAADFGAVAKACKRDDAQACKAALLLWARANWKQQPPTSLGAIAVRVDDRFAGAIDELNRVLYASSGGKWQGAEMLVAARQWRKSRSPGTEPQASPLKPMRPERSVHP